MLLALAKYNMHAHIKKANCKGENHLLILSGSLKREVTTLYIKERIRVSTASSHTT